MKRARWLGAIAVVACLLGVRDAATAAGPSATLGVTSTTVTFTPTDLSSAALAGSTSVSATLTFTTSLHGGGTVVVTPPTTLNATGDTLNTTDFQVQCTLQSGSNGFTSLGVLSLNGATTCATLGSHYTNVTSNFTISLFLNDTPAAPVPFYAANFGPGTFTVTATAN